MLYLHQTHITTVSQCIPEGSRAMISNAPVIWNDHSSFKITQDLTAAETEACLNFSKTT